MIEIQNITKSFDGFVAVKNIDLNINTGMVYGLLGTNGAGKSTLLRMIAGVLKPDGGQVLLDSKSTYDNPETKEKIFFIADDAYFFSYSTGEEMAKYYSGLYESFDMEFFYQLMEKFSLDCRRKIGTFSKGMKKQLSIILGICSKTEYLLCDETFDGLDPVMRQAVKSLLAKEMSERTLTPIIASHNLRELEDICDTVGLIHQGGVLLSKELDEVKCNIQKAQCVFSEADGLELLKSKCDVLNISSRGRLHVFTIRGKRDEIEAVLDSIPTVFCEVLPLTLEEIFISETEVVGYDIKKLLLEA